MTFKLPLGGALVVLVFSGGSSGSSSGGGGSGFGGLGGYTNTPEGKALAAAFGDAYNKLVRAMREYKPQQVQGGLGKGGKLKVGD